MIPRVGQSFVAVWDGVAVTRTVREVLPDGSAWMEVTSGRCKGRQMLLDAEECNVYFSVARKVPALTRAA